MSDTRPSPFRDAQRDAWTYHRATCRWLYNAAAPDEHRLAPRNGEEYGDAPFHSLPPPAIPGPPLGALLEARQSCRRFSTDSMTLNQLSGLAWAAYGVDQVVEFGSLELAERTVPSGGGLYPLELWFLVGRAEGLAPGAYHYHPSLHGLELVRPGAFAAPFLTYLFMGQAYAAEAAVIAILSAVPSRSLAKYRDRGYRYMLLEAGHAMQNLNLAAQAVGLGCCNFGGFYDDELADLCLMDVESQFPLYACAVGIPDSDGDDLRIPRATG